MLLRPLLPIAVLLTSGCSMYARPSIQPAPLDLYVAESPDRVFASLLEIYTDLGMPIARVDGAARFLEGRQVRYAPGEENDEFFDCGQSSGPWRLWTVWTPRAPRIYVYSRITTVMMPHEGGTRVHHKHDAADESGGEIGCVSTGALEQRISDLMRHRLSTTSP